MKNLKTNNSMYNKCFRSIALYRALKANLIIALIIALPLTGSAQLTTITTESGSNYTGANGVGGNSAITFVIENSNSFPVELIDVDVFWNTTNNGTVPALWYTSTNISGPANITSPGWTEITRNTSAMSITANAYYPTFTNIGFTIPPNTVYRFAVESTNGIRYSGTAGPPAPNNFTQNGVSLQVYDYQISSQNVGLGGSFPNPANNPRAFTGRIHFQPAISDAPVAQFYVADTLFTGSNTDIQSAFQSFGWEYQWMVNGSPVSTQSFFTFNPSTAGSYDIALTVTSGQSSDMTTRTVYVIDPYAPPVANFIANKNLIYMGDSVRFADLSTQAPNVWHWEVSPATTQIDPDPNFPQQPTYNFSYGYNAGSQNPFITFHYPGIYAITLTASRGQDSDTETKTEYINVAFPLGVIFPIMETTDNPAGAFSDDGGSSAYGNNDGKFLIAPCADNLYIVFDHFELECGSDHLRIYDGASDSTGTPLYGHCSTNGFTGGGDQAGCASTDICLPPDTLYSKSGRFYIEYEGGNNPGSLKGFLARWGSSSKTTPPNASFTAPETVCTQDQVEFINTSTGAGITGYKWDYSSSGIIADETKDGSFSYFQPGTYHPRLIVEDCAGLVDTFTTPINVVNPTQPSNIKLEADNYEPWSKEDVVTLSADLQACVSSFEWNITPSSYSFEEGSDEFSRNPQIIFHQPGCYNVQLIVSNSAGSGIVTESCLIEVRGYCTPVVGQTSEDIGVSRVIIGTINHSKSVGASAYSNFSEDFTTDLRKGETYQITIQRKTTANSMDRAVWIDWNQNGSFSDPTELIAYESNARTSSYTATFTVPGHAAEGRSRLRIGTGFGGSTLNSCGNQFIGEFIDYGVNILPSTSEPVITLDGDNPLNLEVYHAYSEPGYSAWDDAYGDLTAEVVVDYSNLDTANLGSYIVTYSVSDNDGNFTTKERQVNVVDTQDPTVELSGPDTLTFEVHTQITDPGVIITDNYWTNLEAEISSNLDKSELGLYEIKYCVIDGSGNGPVCVTRIVEIVDTTPPDILLPSDTIVTEVLEPFDFEAIHVSDNYWGDDEIDVEFTGISDVPDALGDFTVTVTARDGSDNTGKATVIVRVVDTTPPVIELNGNSLVNVRIHSMFDDPMVTVFDNFDPAPEVVVGGNFQGTEVVGVYYRTYYAVDQSGNESETIQRTIFVDPAVNIKDEDAFEVLLYPNPASTFIEVKVTGLNNYSIEVSDLTGRSIKQIQTGEIAGGNQRIDMSEYAEGIYLVRISDAKYSVVKKVNVVR